MGIFDSNIIADKINSLKKEDSYSEEFRNLKANRSRAIMEIGEKYFEMHKDDINMDIFYSEEIKSIIETDKALELLEKKRLAAQGMKLCEACGNELPIASGFCNKCGSKQGELSADLIRASHICPSCGTRIEDSDMFCVGCGYQL